MDQPVKGDHASGSTYYPAPPAYTPTPQQTPVNYPPPTPATVVLQPVLVQQQVVFGQVPVVTTCPEGHRVTTNIYYKNGDMTYALAAILCFLLGPIAAVVPFFIDSMKDVEHRCPIDGTVLGVYKRNIF